MSIPRKDKSLLTPTEKDRLKNPQTDPNIRKRNNLIVKEKIKRWLNDANDVCYALEHLKDTKIEDVFSDEDIFALFNATKNLLGRLHFEPVQGEPQHPFIAWHHVVTYKDWMKNKQLAPSSLAAKGRRATLSDFERNWQVARHVKFLENCYHSDPEKESTAYKKYRRKREYKELIEACARHGLRFLDQTEEEYVNAP
jgi:hypothetical protein